MCVGCRGKRTVKVSNTSSCMHMYNELVILDNRALSLFNKTGNSDFIILNKQVRGWIRNLKKECPPVEDVEALIDFLELNEHTVDSTN